MVLSLLLGQKVIRRRSTDFSLSKGMRAFWSIQANTRCQDSQCRCYIRRRNNLTSSPTNTLPLGLLTNTCRLQCLSAIDQHASFTHICTTVHLPTSTQFHSIHTLVGEEMTFTAMLRVSMRLGETQRSARLHYHLACQSRVEEGSRLCEMHDRRRCGLST